MIIFNLFAIPVVLAIYVVYYCLQRLFPVFMAGPHEALVVGIIATVVGGISSRFGITGRVFFLPIWLIGLGITCIQLGWPGTIMLVLIVGVGIVWLIKRGKQMEIEEWSKAQSEILKTPAPLPNFTERQFWEWAKLTLFIPVSQPYTPEVCGHNLKVLDAMLNRSSTLAPKEVATFAFFSKFLQAGMSAPKPLPIDDKLRRAVTELLDLKVRKADDKTPLSAKPPLIPTRPSNPPTIPIAPSNQECMAESALEEMLNEVKYGGLSPGQVLPRISNSTVIVLQSARDPNNPGLITQPLLLSGPGNERSLALFTSEARAKSVRESRPEYQYTCAVPFSAALKSLSPNVGISFNAGWKTSIDISAEVLATFKLPSPAGV